jgi:hypothetical protein
MGFIHDHNLVNRNRKDVSQMTYQPNSQSEFTWDVYDHRDNYIGRVTTDRNSEGAAKCAARDEFGPDTYKVFLVQ